jgi:hypothetical protein
LVPNGLATTLADGFAGGVVTCASVAGGVNVSQ